MSRAPDDPPRVAESQASGLAAGVVPAPPVQRGGGFCWQCCALVYILLLCWSLARIPVPGVNETHYLAKARHLWTPEWCAGDPFLESSNPHLVFYLAVGWLTKWLPLGTVSVVGRAAGLALLAVGWQKLGQTVIGSRWGLLWAVTIFGILQVLGNWSGEWLVGGIESKVPAYGLLFYGLGCWWSGQRVLGVVSSGMAVSFHPIVGLWGILAGIGGDLLPWLKRQQVDASLPRPSVKEALLLCGLLTLFSLPGLVPAVELLMRSTPEHSLQANYLQFAGRLSHHLDPVMFPLTSHRYFAMQVIIWLLLRALSSRTPSDRTPSDRTPSDRTQWTWFVVSTLLIAAAGVLLAAGPRPVKLMPGWEWRINLLKFYPFRLADLVVPLAVAFESARFIERQVFVNGRRTAATMLGWLICGIFVVVIPGSDRNPSQLTAAQQERWIAALIWTREHSQPDELIYGFDEQWAVKWFAERPEYVNYKDCPQDADGILEWNRRQWVIARWNRAAYLNADALFSAAELRELHEKTGIHWFLCSRKIRVAATPAYSNREYAVYRTTVD